MHIVASSQLHPHYQPTRQADILRITHPMDPASLTLTVLGSLHICLRYETPSIYPRPGCNNLGLVRDDIFEIVPVVEGVWLKTEVQLNLVKRLFDSGSLDPALLAHYGDVMQRLRVKISEAITGLEAIDKRSAYAASIPQLGRLVYLKRHLQDVVSDLEDWQRRFDPSWYLITQIAGPVVDKQVELGLSKQKHEPSAARLLEMREAAERVSSQEKATTDSVFKSPNLIQERQHIPGTNSYVSRYVEGGRHILLDSTSYPSRSTPTTRKAHVRDLARLLHHVAPMTFSLLKCEGVIEVSTDQDTQFQFIFEIPQGLHSPTTLRALLTEKPQYSLSRRVQLSKQLARSVMFVHTTGFVHKGIRPETIVAFHENQDIGPSFLIGFERIRRAEAQTDLLGDLEWERNLYRHPVRQGIWSEETFVMQHDIYSLGVCLLEIALWQSFVTREENELTTPWVDLGIQEAISDKDARRGGFAAKRKLVTLAKDRLPSLVGDRYTDIVLACLCCLDEGEGNVFSNVKDNDGIVVGVRYIENILVKLEELLI
ncbi:hypothetical protein FQN54_005955 [Arachnomyces sp. PD_36]|nr:hypothetical protein FQN54_005955 [Arachnomyces sp. PD_36]